MNENGQEMELIRSMTAVEIKPETAREELSSRNYSKVPLSRITALGVGFEPLTAALQQVLSGGEAVSGIYRVTIPAGTHLAQFKGSTDFLGAALGAGRIEAQARLNPLMFSPAAVGTLLMAATLANIDKKLDAIQETQQEMLDFLKAKERSALMGDLEFLGMFLITINTTGTAKNTRLQITSRLWTSVKAPCTSLNSTAARYKSTWKSARSCRATGM